MFIGRLPLRLQSILKRATIPRAFHLQETQSRPLPTCTAHYMHLKCKTGRVACVSDRYPSLGSMTIVTRHELPADTSLGTCNENTPLRTTMIFPSG